MQSYQDIAVQQGWTRAFPRAEAGIEPPRSPLQVGVKECDAWVEEGLHDPSPHGTCMLSTATATAYPPLISRAAGLRSACREHARLPMALSWVALARWAMMLAQLEKNRRLRARLGLGAAQRHQIAPETAAHRPR